MVALDAARGLAVIGMIAVNTGPRGDDELLEMIYRIPYGRASLLFVLLGGIGLSLMTRRSRLQRTPLPGCRWCGGAPCCSWADWRSRSWVTTWP